MAELHECLSANKFIHLQLWYMSYYYYCFYTWERKSIKVWFKIQQRICCKTKWLLLPDTVAISKEKWEKHVCLIHRDADYSEGFVAMTAVKVKRF